MVENNDGVLCPSLAFCVSEVAAPNQCSINGCPLASLLADVRAADDVNAFEESGLPVLAATAEFFAGWAESNADGSYSLNQTQGFVKINEILRSTPEV